MEKPLSLKDRILTDMKSAMKEKSTSKLMALKLVYAECRNKEIEQKADLEDLHITAILQKQIKQYEESLKLYEKAGRGGDAQEQKNRLEIIKSYLPKALSEEELKSLVEETITSLKAVSMKDMGQVIKTARSRAGGLVDSRRLAELVKERLQAI